MHRKRIILLCFILVLILTSCAQEVHNKSLFTKDTYPHIDGSTATIPLSEKMAETLLNLSTEESKEFIKHNTTHMAYDNLFSKKADIIFVTEPSIEELALAEYKRIELEVIPVVKEAFVFLVNKNNPVNELTVEEIQNIYEGKITNWKELGGEDLEIIPYQRPNNSGSQTLMQNIVMKDLKLMDAPKELRTSTMGGLIENIASYDNSDGAIGYSVYYYANTMYIKDAIKFIKVNGVEPNKENIISESYPFTSAYYAVLRKNEPENSSARKLLSWILSNEGQELAEQSGYVPLR